MSTSAIKENINIAIQRIIGAMNLDYQADILEELRDGKTVVTVAIRAPEHGRFLIGKNGQNLQALEHIVRTISLKGVQDEAISLTLDVNDYKKSKVARVVEIARQAVMRVRNTKRAEALAPMSAYERRVVHMELASVSDIATESVGQEPQRRIVIKPYF